MNEFERLHNEFAEIAVSLVRLSEIAYSCLSGRDYPRFKRALDRLIEEYNIERD